MKSLNDVLWSARTREEIPAWAEKNTVVIVPIASTEQHGLALPLDTDRRTVDYVAVRAAQLAEDVPCLVAPTIPYGVSPHHMVFPGTITFTVETTIRVLREVCQSIAAHGFDRILILSGHGGNQDTIGAAALELRHELGRQIEANCWFYYVSDLISETREGPVETIGHAGESEASAIMMLAPELVRRDRMKVVPGISDDPSLGTLEKGRIILDGAAEAVAERLRHLASLPGRKVVGIATVEKEKE